jgi:hypothetical protein
VYYLVVDGKGKNGAYKLLLTSPFGYDAWSSWVDGKKAMVGTPTMLAPTFETSLYQTIKGTDLLVWNRQTTDGYSWTTWDNTGKVLSFTTTPTLIPAKTASTIIAVQEFNGKVYQTMRENVTNRVLTREVKSPAVDWTADAKPLYKAGGNISMVEFGGKLYQATRSLATTATTTTLKRAANDVMTRSSATGVFDGGWQFDTAAKPVKAAGDITMIEFDYKLYQATRAFATITPKVTGNVVLWRATTNGTAWITQPGSTLPDGWVADAKKSAGNVALAVFDGRLYMAIREAVTNKVLTRYTTDGTTWQPWIVDPKLAASDVVMKVAELNGQMRLYQVINSAGKVTTRYTLDGDNWTAWVPDGVTTSATAMEQFGDVLYQATKGSLGKVWYRFTTGLPLMAPRPELTAAEPTVTIKKAGTGTGTITLGEDVCDAACAEITIPYAEGAKVQVQVTPAADSVFVRWEKADGTALAGIAYAQPGDTVVAVFNKAP